MPLVLGPQPVPPETLLAARIGIPRRDVAAAGVEDEASQEIERRRRKRAVAGIEVAREGETAQRALQGLTGERQGEYEIGVGRRATLAPAFKSQQPSALAFGDGHALQLFAEG